MGMHMYIFAFFYNKQCCYELFGIHLLLYFSKRIFQVLAVFLTTTHNKKYVLYHESVFTYYSLLLCTMHSDPLTNYLNMLFHFQLWTHILG